MCVYNMYIAKVQHITFTNKCLVHVQSDNKLLQFWCTCCYMCVYNHVHCKGSTHYKWLIHVRSDNVVRGVKSTASVSFVRACVYKAVHYTAH